MLSTISRVKTGAGGRADSGEALLRRMAARRRRDNIVVAVLAALAVLGGGHAVFSIFSTAPAPPGDESTIATLGHARLAESFAQDFVITYLGAASGQQDRLARFVAGTERVTLPKVAQQVSDPLVVYTTRSMNSGSVEVWSITVSVRVGRPGPHSGRHYYRVPVLVSEGRLRALALPAAVEPPAVGPDLAQAYSSPCAEDTPLAQVATGFLNAYLTGSGDVTRYVTVDSGITPLLPAPYSTLTTVTVTADDSACGTTGSDARVLATVSPKTGGGIVPSLAYPLTMVRGEGQWQVRSIDPLPALSNPLAVVEAQETAPGQSAGSPTATPTTTVEIPPATQN